jgi:hypothetical protein
MASLTHIKDHRHHPSSSITIGIIAGTTKLSPKIPGLHRVDGSESSTRGVDVKALKASTGAPVA